MQANGQSLYVKFSETPVTLRPFDLQVGVAAESVEGRFQMQGMEMGLNRYQLHDDAGNWHARIILPVCMQGRGDWMLLLEIKKGGDTRFYRLPFKSG
jgi:hypothetical protein